MQQAPNRKATFIRNFVFGVEDGLVSTVGFLSGIAVAAVPKSTILLTGIILVFVEAVSMAAGTFLAEDFTDDYLLQKEVALSFPLRASLTMFISYFLAGLVPIIPYIIAPLESAFIWSIILTILALVVFGVITSKLSKVNVAKNSIRMLIIAGLAIVVGVGIGKIIGTFGISG